MIGHLYTLLFADQPAPPPTPVGRSAWMRDWLQRQYEQDFAKYEAERAKLKDPVVSKRPAPAPVIAKAASKPRPPTATPTAPPPAGPRGDEILARVFGTVRQPPRTAFTPEIPPLADMSGVRVAVQDATVRLRPDEEEALLAAAMVFRL